MTGQQTSEIESHFAGKGYAQLKHDLADVTVEFLRPFQERVNGTGAEQLNRILGQGRAKARQIAGSTLANVYAAMGIVGASDQ